jgi:putative transposase
MHEIRARFGLSQRRFCRLTGWNRSTLQHQPAGRDDSALRQRLRHGAALKPRWGSPILHDVLKAEGLALRRKHRRKLPAIARVPLPRPTAPNQRWSMDFIHDQLANGRRFRCLTLVDDFTRQCLALHVDPSIGGSAVVAVLGQLANSRGLPSSITTDNGPEFTGRALHLLAQAAGVSLNHIQPGKECGFAEYEGAPSSPRSKERAEGLAFWTFNIFRLRRRAINGSAGYQASPSAKSRNSGLPHKVHPGTMGDWRCESATELS